MIAIKQSKLHNPPESMGNCSASVLASLLELPIDEVIDISTLPDDTWYIQKVLWLYERGLRIRYAPEFGHAFHHSYYPIPDEMVKDKYYIVTGKTNRFEGKVNHVCIYQNGKLAHDPHPDNTGLTTFEWFEIIEPINPQL